MCQLGLLKCRIWQAILIFKNQGEEQNDECDNIGRDDFLLDFQTDYQCELDNNGEVPDNETDFDNNGVCNRMDLTYYSELLWSNSKAMSFVSSKQLFEEKFSELQLLVSHCSSCEIINTVCSHLTSAITVVMAASTMEAPVASSIVVRKLSAPNSNSEK